MGLASVGSHPVVGSHPGVGSRPGVGSSGDSKDFSPRASMRDLHAGIESAFLRARSCMLAGLGRVCDGGFVDALVYWQRSPRLTPKALSI